MSKIIAYGNPHWLSPGYKYRGETKVIEALQELSEQINTEFAGQPDVQADLHLKFAEAFHFHGGEELFARKRFHIDRALELRKSIYGDYHEKVAQVLYMKWAGLPTDDPRQAEILMQAIAMMRGTNPNNLNLPYMYLDYAGRMMSMDEIKFGEGSSILIEKNVRVPSNEELRRMYRKAVLPSSDENNFEIAEKMLREATPIFRFYYQENNFAIVRNECLLSYALAKQNKRTDFDEHFRVCRSGETQMPDDQLKTYRKTIEAIGKNSVGNAF